ncbi:MAG: hypothetical protein LBO69_01630 [Ignavibacteria bacterium]|jgi:hypothetical protein|nr:hypothetical protein [Ignavibacteria bacterium]
MKNTFKYFVAIVAIIISSSLFYSESSFAVDAKDSKAFQLYKQQLEKKQKKSAGKQSAESSKSSSSRSSSKVTDTEAKVTSSGVTDAEAMEQLDAYWIASIVWMNQFTIVKTCYNEYGKKVNTTDKAFKDAFYNVVTQCYGVGFELITGEYPELSPSQLKKLIVNGEFFYLKKERDASSGDVSYCMLPTDEEFNNESKCCIIAGVLQIVENLGE